MGMQGGLAKSGAIQIGTQKRVVLTPKQANIYQWGWQPEARYRYAVCGRRFGKTFLMMEEQRRAVRLAVERGVDTDNEIWYGGTTRTAAERNYWRLALRATPESWIAHINNSKLAITYKSGHVFRLVGLEDFDALRGKGLYFFMGDEWADTKPEAWTEAIEPMLMTTQGHAIFIGTPKGFNHFYDGWARGQPGEARDPETMSWLYTTLQGGNVPQSEVDKKKRNTDEKTFRQEYMATFETYGGQIYYAFKRSENIKRPPWYGQFADYSDKPSYNPDRPIQIGMDFNIDPMTAHLYQEDVVNGRVISYQIDEIAIESSNTNEMAREIASRYGNYRTENPVGHITIYPDPAGAGRRTAAHGNTDHSILREAGFGVRAMSSAPLIRDRINFVNARYANAAGERSLFVSPECTRSIAAAEKQAYKKGTSEPEKDGHDHDNDCTGYYCYTRFGTHAPQVTSVNHMGR